MQDGPLEVLSIAADLPHTIHLITNYGFFFYHYNVNLTDRTQIFPYYQAALTPAFHRIIRYEMDNFNNELSMNPYGYAFLMTEYNDSINYDVILGTVSFFSGTNNKIFRLKQIVSNQ